MKLTKRKDGRYCKAVKINGVYKYFYSNENTERKAERDIKNQMAKYNHKERGKYEFTKVAGDWERLKREEIDSVTWIKYHRASYNQVVEYFKNSFIDDITPGDVQRFFLYLKSLNYARKTVKARKSVLQMIFNHAFLKGQIDNNFINIIELPKGLTVTKRKVPTDSEIEIITKNYDGDDFLYYFMAYTGLRISEACALTDKDFDYENKLINIDKKVIWENNKPILVQQTKTFAGTRKTILLDVLAEKMPKFKGYLFGDDNGKNLITKKHLQSKVEGYQKRHGISCTPHQLRHAYVTLAVEAGLDIKEVQHIAGHADIHTTMNIYAEFRPKHYKAIAEKLNAVDY